MPSSRYLQHGKSTVVTIGVSYGLLCVITLFLQPSDHVSLHAFLPIWVHYLGLACWLLLIAALSLERLVVLARSLTRADS